MNMNNLSLNEFIPKGQVTCDYREDCIIMTTKHAIPTQRFDAEHLSINSYLYLPTRYKLPLRIDMTVKLDAPGFYLLFGNGHVNFGTLWSDNRRLDDIAVPSRKTMNYHNNFRMNEFTDISILYDLKEMQIMINGEERYYSNKERYMKAPIFREMNQEGFQLKLVCDKLVQLCIKSFAVTEYPDTCGIVHSKEALPTAVTRNEAIAQGEKPTFDKCISLLPEGIQSEIIKIDEYLKSLKTLKFKRQIDKNGSKITYIAADYGFSYAIYLSNDIFDHSLQWYLITNGKPETWHRKDDRMEETLTRLAVITPEFAQRMFYQLEDCVGCYKNCLARTRYRLGEQKKAVCHGKLKFSMNVSGFEDVRTFINEINRLIQID
jgi:hypothetical protein